MTAPAPALAQMTDEARAAFTIWQREMLQYLRDPIKVGITLLQPALFLLVVGTGLSTVLPSASHGTDYRTFLYPGILVMTVQTQAITAGASLAADRQTGFLREILLAPVRRDTLLAGRCAGGATVATCQGALLLALAGAARLPYRPTMLMAILAELALIALTMTTVGILLAVTIRRTETFHALLSVLVMPLVFLSGAMFPTARLPAWLSWVVTINPVSYAVDAVRQTITTHLHTETTGWQLGGPLWNNHHPSVFLELMLITVLGAVLLTISAHRFTHIN